MLNFDQIEKYKENNRIEAKKAVGGFPHSLWETYSAFANTIGGVILLGVEEMPDKSFRAAELPDPQMLVDTFWQGVQDETVVSRNILSKEQVSIQYAQDKPIVVIEVPMAKEEDKPIFIGADPYCGTYCRNGEGDYRCNVDEVRWMMAQKEAIVPSKQILRRLGTDFYCPETLQRYRERLRENDHADWAALPDQELLVQIHGLERDTDGKLYPTGAGVLLFGKRECILSEFPNYFLDYRQKDGTDENLTGRITSSDTNWSGNVFDFYFLVCEAIEKEYGQEEELVMASVREGLANALMHANYFGRKCVLVEKRKKSITMTNAGGMRISVQDAWRGGVRDARNEQITDIFHYAGIGRQQGYSLAQIRAAWEKQGRIMPKLQDRRDFTVFSLLFHPKKDGKRAKQEERLLDYLTEHITCTRKQAAEFLQVSEKTAAKYLHTLMEEQLLSQKREGHYKVYYLRA